MTPLGVVFLFMLVNLWVEKHQRFLFNVYKRFFYFCHVFFTFLTFFIFSGTFFTSMVNSKVSLKQLFLLTRHIYRLDKVICMWHL